MALATREGPGCPGSGQRFGPGLRRGEVAIKLVDAPEGHRYYCLLWSESRHGLSSLAELWRFPADARLVSSEQPFRSFARAGFRQVFRRKLPFAAQVVSIFRHEYRKEPTGLNRGLKRGLCSQYRRTTPFFTASSATELASHNSLKHRPSHRRGTDAEKM